MSALHFEHVGLGHDMERRLKMGRERREKGKEESDETNNVIIARIRFLIVINANCSYAT